ncbi:MAG: mannose-1-phosphate guanylyltransferase, partial [Anaerolineales bacterium]|nr:mannose-1-phosphate guanylyltransferase [Anaerolineales bacterium]
ELPEENFVLEPLPRGTASAIGLTAVVLQKRDPQAVMSVLTADHFIADPELFRRILVAAHDVAQDDYLVTLGIHPTYPATGYGYIQQGEQIDTYDGLEVFKALRFREKPDRETAEQMLASADHAWNSGMFMWRVDRVMTEFERQMPELFAALTEIAAAWGTSEQEATVGRIWPQIKPETIDYGIMENAQQVAVIPAEGLGWNDVGSWDSFFDMLPTNEDGNILHCEQHINLDTRDSMVYADCDDRLIVTIGVKDLVIVDTGDVLMVCSKEHAQDVREAIKQLKEKDQTEYL